MKVTLIAHTALAEADDLSVHAHGWLNWRHEEGFREGTPDELDGGAFEWFGPTPADKLGEFAGRACYQAWERKNPATAENAGYLANILKQGHESVLEHSSCTFYLTGVSRSLTHELIRHRHLSFSELSQRYVNVEDSEFVLPPALRDLGVENWSGEWEGDDYANDYHFRGVRITYAQLVRYLEDKGLKRKQAREAARAVMPNATETRIVVTGNLRAWRDVLRKRYHVAADAEIRELATELLCQLRQVAPSSFQDFPDRPFGTEE